MTKPAETNPKFWDVVFSLKTFAAGMLALWIGLVANLPNPYWSIAAVYIVAHPLSGATTSKGFYRLIGTIIGGAVTILFVPHLVNSPEILTLAIGLWMGLCLAISLLDGTPRSYLFMLAGYTVAIASFCRCFRAGNHLRLRRGTSGGNRDRHHLCRCRQSSRFSAP